MNEVAYTPEAPDNPNFVSRPPDPGFLQFSKTIGWDALYHAPFSGVYRFSKLELESNDYFNVDGALLSPEEANKKYGMRGQLKFDEPIKESAAQLMMSRKIDENDRDYIIGSGSTSGYRQAAGIGIGMAASLLDPANFASMFVPIVGEARFGRMVTRFGGSVLKARLAAGAIEGGVGAAMVEPFILLPSLQEQSNYGLADSAANLGYGAALGSFLHAGFGAIGDRLKRLKPVEKDAIFEAAMSDVLGDKPVSTPARVVDFAEDAPIRVDDPIGPIQIPEQRETLNDLIGQEVDYAGYQGKLIRDEEGNFVVLREVSSDGKPQYIEVANTGKDPELRATEADVFRRGFQEQLAAAKLEGLKNLQQEISNQQVRASDQTRIEQQGQKINEDVKTEISRLNTEDLRSPSETPKLLTDIEKEVGELEKTMNLDETRKAAIDEQMKVETGEAKKREVAYKTAVECIIKNLI